MFICTDTDWPRGQNFGLGLVTTGLGHGLGTLYIRTYSYIRTFVLSYSVSWPPVWNKHLLTLLNVLALASSSVSYYFANLTNQN